MSENPWFQLRQFTNARIVLGRAGDSLPTRRLLELGLAHAQARDAVLKPFDTNILTGRLKSAGFDSVHVHSLAPDRSSYLLRPDLGRRLEEASYLCLKNLRLPWPPDIVFVIADGLSAQAAERHALPVLCLTCAALPDWKIGPVIIAEQSRVALGDEIGECLNAEFVAILLGERPGLSSPDSLGIYVTYRPRVGCTDAQRNCISNVRHGGLSYERAAHKLSVLLSSARKMAMTGVGLKDVSDFYLLNDDKCTT